MTTGTIDQHKDKIIYMINYSPSRTTYVNISTSSTTSSSSAAGTSITSSFTNAAIIIGQIILVTIIIVFLFKKGWIKILIGFFMVVVLLLLGFMTYLLILQVLTPLMVTIATNFLFLGKNSNLVQVFLIPLDYVTMVFALWNFTVVGLVSIFWKGPLWLQQIYLTVMSSLMVSVIIQGTVAHFYLGIFINGARAVDNMDPAGTACNMG